MNQVKFVQRLCFTKFTRSILEYTLLQLKHHVNELTFLVNVFTLDYKNTRSTPVEVIVMSFL